MPIDILAPRPPCTATERTLAPPAEAPRSISREGWLLLMLAFLGGALALVFYPLTHPLAQASLDAGRPEAQATADAYLAARGHDLATFPERATSTLTQFRLLAYAEEAAPEEAARVRQHDPAVLWRVLYRSADERTTVEVQVGADGRIVRYRYGPPDDATGARLAEAEALALARSFLTQEVGADLAGLPPPNVQRIGRDERMDYVFAWMDTTGTAHLRWEATVQGDAIGGWHRDVRLPEAFDERYDARLEGVGLFQTIPQGVINLVWIVALVIFALRFRESEVSIRNAVLVTALFLLAFGIDRVGLAQSLLRVNTFGQGEAENSLQFLGQALGWVFTGMALFLVWISGESLAREVWPQKLRALDGLFARRYVFPDLGRGILRGFALGLLSVGLTMLLAWIVTRTGAAWVVPTQMDGLLLASPFPFLHALAYGVYAALLMASWSALFTLTALKRYLRYLPVAVFLTVLLYGTTGESLIGFRSPWWEAAVGLVVSPIAYVFFLRYGLLTLIVGFCVQHLVGASALYLWQPAPWYALSGLGLLIVLGVLALFATYARFRGEELDDEAIAPSYARHINERLRLRAELEVARRAQLQMLPRRLPRPAALDLAAFSEPAREVGGDYYDVLELSEQRLGLIVGDVSGKGMPAALYMTMLKGFTRSFATPDAAPADVLRHINRGFFQTAEAQTFVTALYGIADLERGTLTFARAGHLPLYIHRAADATSLVLQPPGLGIGLEKGPLFDRVIAEETIRLHPGDVALFCTDGLVEAVGERGEEFGQERTLALLQAHAHAPAEEILAALRRALAQFVGRQEPHDDLTCLLVKVR